MGRTRKRVTVLVLSLEAIGLLLVLAAVWLAGGERVHCERSLPREPSAENPAEPGAATCVAEVRRLLGLMTPSTRRLERVVSASVAEPGLGRATHWLTLATAEGDEARVLAGTQSQAASDVERLARFFAAHSTRTEPALSAPPEALKQVTLRRSNLLPALALVGFGSLWLLVISLIMREFLGFHTPWWWRVLGRDRGRPRADR